MPVLMQRRHAGFWPVAMQLVGKHALLSTVSSGSDEFVFTRQTIVFHGVLPGAEITTALTRRQKAWARHLGWVKMQVHLPNTMSTSPQGSAAGRVRRHADRALAQHPCVFNPRLRGAKSDRALESNSNIDAALFSSGARSLIATTLQIIVARRSINARKETQTLSTTNGGQAVDCQIGLPMGRPFLNVISANIAFV